jgi:hypothetical protein
MAYVAQSLDQRIGSTTTWVGVNSECVALVRAWSNAPPSGGWVAGQRVRGNGNSIARGTVIATFVDGHYEGHAAIFLGETGDGIRVYDQWNAQKPHERTIYYAGTRRFVNDGDNYYVVE